MRGPPPRPPLFPSPPPSRSGNPPVLRPWHCHARRVTPPLDAERCYRAVASRDARFDGWFFTAVATTGIYCRPSCPARTPLPHNVTFFSTEIGRASCRERV